MTTYDYLVVAVQLLSQNGLMPQSMAIDSIIASIFIAFLFKNILDIFPVSAQVSVWISYNLIADFKFDISGSFLKIVGSIHIFCSVNLEPSFYFKEFLDI